MGVALSNFCFSHICEKPPLPSSALPASGFVGIISARVLKAPLTGRKDGEGFCKTKVARNCYAGHAYKLRCAIVPYYGFRVRFCFLSNKA